MLQFSWWAYFLLHFDPDKLSERARFTMILGEGGVFMLILIFAFTRLIISLGKESKLNQQKDNFLMSITHELKTPIAHNKLTLQTLLKRKDIPSEKQQELLEKVLSENGRLQHLVENLLTATRLEARYFKPQKEKFNLHEKVTALIENYAILLKDTEINIISHVENPIVYADSTMIDTVLINLIENYHKYAINATELQIEIHSFEDKIKCTLKDNGEGVPDKFKKEMFKKFVRNENEETRTKKGTGLGLYIAKEFMKINKGNIRYIPNQPKGAIFELIIPRA